MAHAEMNASLLPEGFVYLDQIEKTILSDIRYGKEWNFLGSPVSGYITDSKVILTEKAALALKKAQEKCQKDGYCLVVYDAYRPQKASNQFMQWGSDLVDQKMKAEFYPRIDKESVHALGYLAKQSGHSRGSAVDVTLIPWGHSLREIVVEKRTLQDGFEICYLNDGTLDMGSSFDLFDVASHYENEVIASSYKERRRYLKELMEAVGFEGYTKEWWHFSLKDEPFPEIFFDFDVK